MTIYNFVVHGSMVINHANKRFQATSGSQQNVFEVTCTRFKAQTSCKTNFNELKTCYSVKIVKKIREFEFVFIYNFVCRTFTQEAPTVTIPCIDRITCTSI